MVEPGSLPTSHASPASGKVSDTQALHGVLYMIAGIALLSVMDAIAKWLIMHGAAAVQIIALRSLIIVPVMLLSFAVRGQLAVLKPVHPRAQALRGLAGIVAPLCFFLGVARMPLTAAVVVFFSSTFMISLLSIVFLKERVGIHRWAAIIIGYLGVFVAMSPGSGGEAIGYALVLLASFAYAVLFVSGRYLSRTDSVASLVLSFNLGVGIVACLCLPWFWQTLDGEQAALIVLLAAVALGGHVCLTQAFALADASLVAPFDYTAVLWTVLLDVLIWRTLPGPATWAGAVIIIGSGLYMIHRERQARHVLRTPV